MMNLRKAMILFLCLIVVLAVSLTASAKDKKINKKDVPTVVISVFGKAYPDAKMKVFATETEDGKTYYEIESVKGKMTIDALLLPDGSFFEVEEGMAVKDVPANVSGAVTAKYPKAKFIKAEKVTHGADISYDLSAMEGKSKISFTVDPNGKILKETKKDLKKEKQEKEDDEEK